MVKTAFASVGGWQAFFRANLRGAKEWKHRENGTFVFVSSPEIDRF